MTETQQLLLDWWRQHGRVLPWREKRDSAKSTVREEVYAEYFSPKLRRDPYRVVVAEMMLQQTQVDRVVPKYDAWMKKWPRIGDLAQATLSEVLVLWQGLGYNRRARFLWLLAQSIEQLGGWPTTEDALMKLPGIGRYTARAVLVFGLGQQCGMVDTNVKRIINRVFRGAESPISEKEYLQYADKITPSGLADPWHQAVMDFGASICTAKAPKCDRCSLQLTCLANQQALQAGYKDYAEYLKQLPKHTKKPSQQVRFEDTDRFFRGRIIDVLRVGPRKKNELQRELETVYGLSDLARFETLLDGLLSEQLISLHDTSIHLG